MSVFKESVPRNVSEPNKYDVTAYKPHVVSIWWFNSLKQYTGYDLRICFLRNCMVSEAIILKRTMQKYFDKNSTKLSPCRKFVNTLMVSIRLSNS